MIKGARFIRILKKESHDRKGCSISMVLRGGILVSGMVGRGKDNGIIIRMMM